MESDLSLNWHKAVPAFFVQQNTERNRREEGGEERDNHRNGKQDNSNNSSFKPDGDDDHVNGATNTMAMSKLMVGFANRLKMKRYSWGNIIYDIMVQNKGVQMFFSIAYSCTFSFLT